MRSVLRSVLGLVLLAGAARVAAAQSVTVTPILGTTRPVSGEMVMWVPLAVGVGFDSAAYSHRFEPGLTFGVLAEYDRAGWLDFAAQLTTNIAQRRIVRRGGAEQPCDCNNSTIIGVGVLAKASRPIRERMTAYAGLGPEFLFMAGNATSNADGFAPPHQLEVDPRLVVGVLGVAGVDVALRETLSMRLHAGYRRFAPSYARLDGASTPPVSYGTEANGDLILSLGFTFRRNAAR